MLGRTMALFAPVPHPEDRPIYKEARAANKLWKRHKAVALRSWETRRVEFKEESEETYLKERNALLDSLDGEGKTKMSK
jgi:hypothetical protein